MRMVNVNREGFDFLKALAKNNEREWFNAHRSEYEHMLGNIADFADGLIEELKTHDLIQTQSGKKALFRIYRDVRFSHDKTPYTLWLSGYFRRATAQLRGGYYFRIQPKGKSVLGGGFWGPNKEDLKHIREQIAIDSEPLRKVIASKYFKKHFGTLNGESLKTYPRGFDPDHPDIDLLRMKTFTVSRSFTDKEVLSADFAKEISKGYKAMRPFFDVMSMYLSTDLNGDLLPNLSKK
jgi:uncharacterized protein (TIGR02453 family)